MSVLIFISALFFSGALAQTDSCDGKRQSPINIQKRSWVPIKTNPLVMDAGYFIEPDSMNIVSDGHSIIITTKQQSMPTLTGGPLKNNKYCLNSIHFHWGENNTVGSEHKLNGKSYVMEIHAVHVKNCMPMVEAREISDGIAVVAYFVEVQNPRLYERSRNMEAFNAIVSSIQNIAESNEVVPCNKLFSLKNLLIPFCQEYVTYLGSLTTSPCSEAVIWIISPYVVKITNKQLSMFRTLIAMDIIDKDIVRAIQPLNGRKIYFTNRNSKDLNMLFYKSYYNYDLLSPHSYDTVGGYY